MFPQIWRNSASKCACVHINIQICLFLNLVLMAKSWYYFSKYKDFTPVNLHLYTYETDTSGQILKSFAIFRVLQGSTFFRYSGDVTNPGSGLTFSVFFFSSFLLALLPPLFLPFHLLFLLLFFLHFHLLWIFCVTVSWLTHWHFLTLFLFFVALNIKKNQKISK